MTTNVFSRLMAGAALALAFLSSAAHAQAVSSFTVQASGTVTSPSGESVAFSGPVQVTATVVTDPAGGPPTSVVSIDARQLVATGATSGAAYVNSGQANLTRPLAATDVIQTTFAFFPDGPGGFLKTRTALLTLNLAYNLATSALTSASGSISSF